MPILRMPAVLAETGHKSQASIYNAIRVGLFTKPVKIGQRAVGWPAEEVHAINAAQIAGKTSPKLLALVNELHLKRSNVD